VREGDPGAGSGGWHPRQDGDMNVARANMPSAIYEVVIRLHHPLFCQQHKLLVDARGLTEEGRAADAYVQAKHWASNAEGRDDIRVEYQDPEVWAA
jgi:hypothetical protein